MKFASKFYADRLLSRGMRFPKVGPFREQTSSISASRGNPKTELATTTKRMS